MCFNSTLEGKFREDKTEATKEMFGIFPEVLWCDLRCFNSKFCQKLARGLGAVQMESRVWVVTDYYTYNSCISERLGREISVFRGLAFFRWLDHENLPANVVL